MANWKAYKEKKRGGALLGSGKEVDKGGEDYFGWKKTKDAITGVFDSIGRVLEIPKINKLKRTEKESKANEWKSELRKPKKSYLDKYKVSDEEKKKNEKAVLIRKAKVEASMKKNAKDSRAKAKERKLKRLKELEAIKDLEKKNPILYNELKELRTWKRVWAD